jgi:hypothetical protein
MTRFIPRWPFSSVTSLATSLADSLAHSLARAPRPSRSMMAALVCAAVALLSYLALVSYESSAPTPIWH